MNVDSPYNRRKLCKTTLCNNRKHQYNFYPVGRVIKMFGFKIKNVLSLQRNQNKVAVQEKTVVSNVTPSKVPPGGH